MAHVQAERHSVQEADNLFRSIFDNSLEAILLMDDAGQILEANPEACYLFGRSLDEFLLGDSALPGSPIPPEVSDALRIRRGRIG